VRTGKVMAYDVSTGKRTKRADGKAYINWVHTVMHIPDFNLKQCLFGLHLLKDKPNKISIVESEKTAIIMSLNITKYTWMATGSLTGFKHEYLEPIKNYDITGFPDKGGFKKWSETANQLNKLGFKINISKILEKDEYEDGWDLLDVMQYEEKSYGYSNTERLVYKFSKMNSNILNLITEFDLTDEQGNDIKIIK